MNRTRYIAIFGFVFLGIMSRFFPHPPNFTAMNSIALFSAMSIGSLGMSFLTVFTTMIISDLFIGFHSSMPFVYLSFGLIIFMGHLLKSKKSLAQTPLFLTTASTLFFIISNFGVWLADSLFPKTLSGLAACYIAAIPFFANQVFGDLAYGIAIFGLFALVEKTVPSVRSEIETVEVF